MYINVYIINGLGMEYTAC